MSAKNSPQPGLPGRELIASRIIDAPRELVFKAWTHPQHVAHWCVPDDFTLTACEMDVRVGGTWLIRMRSDHGLTYEMPRVYREITPPQRLVFTDPCLEEGRPFFDALTTVTFEDQDGKTRLTIHTESVNVLSKDDRQDWTNGWIQILQRLDQHLTQPLGDDA